MSDLSRPVPSQPAARVIIDVAAGLIFRDGRLLITQRKAGSHLAGLWEFPGGKREPGENWEDCLQRELREELAVEVGVGRLFSEVTHAYAEKTVHLRFYICVLISGEPQALDCAALVWVTAEELGNYSFPAADAGLLASLPNAPEFRSAETA